MSREQIRFKIKNPDGIVYEDENKVSCNDITEYISGPCRVCLIKTLYKKFRKQQRVANLIGIPQSLVSYYLSGTWIPSNETTKRIFDAAMRYCYEEALELLSQDFDNHEYLLDYLLRGTQRTYIKRTVDYCVYFPLEEVYNLKEILK